MWLLILEAVAALAVLVFIVWWTMFSGRSPPDPGSDPAKDPGQAGGSDPDSK